MGTGDRGPVLLAQVAAIAWGLQFAFLNPALALLLTDLLGATEAQVGLVLALYNASGFVASLVVPAWADRRGDYLGPMLGSGGFALALAGALAVAGSLPVAAAALIVLGGPAGVGSSLFFAHLRASGWGPSEVMRARAMVSASWVAGPPLAMLLAGFAGTRAVLLAIMAISLTGIGAVLALRRRRTARSVDPAAADDSSAPLSRSRVSGVVVAFIALQATNAATTSIVTLFTVSALGLDAIWGGIALAVAALAEIPALLVLGRLSTRYGPVALLSVGSLAGIAFYLAMAYVADPITLIAAQLLNAWFFATLTGVGLTWFQDIIARPGLASGTFANTRRIGAIVSGGVIAIAGTSAGYTGMFLVCAALTAAALVLILIAGRRKSDSQDP
ncbi:MAG: MFS transporter [Micropruina sp.]|uniref:MFS transporter n=1 Tax=Micropruina sp. TaxID=2737536 RepID=UPI0039E580E5